MASIAVLLGSAIAIAQYQVPLECPDRAAFLAEVRARAPELELDADALFVEIDRQGASIAGAITIDGAVRHVSGADCAEVVRALAVIAAFSIERIAASPPAARAPIVPRIAAEPAAARESQWHAAAGAGVGTSAGILPSSPLVVPIFVELAANGGLAPILRASFSFSTADARVDGFGSARFTFVAVRADLASGAIAPWSSLRLEPGLSVEAGSLHGRGAEDVAASGGATSVWAAVGAIVRARWTPFDPIFVAAEGGVRVPLIRQPFDFLPDVTVHRPAAVVADASIGAGVLFW